MKYTLSSSTSSAVLAFLGFVINYPAVLFIYRTVLASERYSTQFGISLLLGLFTLQYIFFELVIWPRIYKSVLLMTFFFNFLSLYAMQKYGIVLNKDIFLSLRETSRGELSEYLNVQLLFFLLIASLSLWFISTKIKIHFQSHKKETARKMSTLCILFFIFTCNIFLFSKDYAFFFREEKVFKHLILPLNYLDAILGTIRVARAQNQPLIDIHSKTQINTSIWKQIPNRSLFVLVVGETARVHNFSLYGYSHLTNPELQKIPHLYFFKNVSSCGTSTATSVPCLFDYRGRSGVNESEQFTNLLDIAQKAQFEVTWIDNNTGCQDVCDRIKTLFTRDLKEAKDFCDTESCYDEILLPALQKAVTESHSPRQLIVLHMLGSHGPKYYKRYPPTFNRFQPDCHSSDLSVCSKEEITNSYDNTIAYTDYVLAKIIDYLNHLKDTNVQLLYISDHGESLGENGLYLHAIPYRLAPDEQTHVPMIFWANQKFFSNFHLDSSCLKKEESFPLTHDYLFHSYLSLLGIMNPFYNPDHDFIKPCQSKGFE